MTAADVCPRCGRIRTADRTVCRSCADGLAQLLTDASGLIPSIDGKRARRGSPAFGATSRSAVVPIPFDARVSPVEHAIRNAVGGWARIIAEEHPRGAQPPHGLARTCRWLAGYCEWLAHHHAAVEAFDELTAAVRTLFDLFEVPPQTYPLGACGVEDDEGIPCPVLLEAEQDAAQVHCRRCKAQHDVHARRRALLESADDYLVTVREAVRLLGLTGHAVDARTIRCVIRVVGIRVEGSMPTPGGGPAAEAYRLGAIRDAVDLLASDDDTRRAVQRMKRGA